MRLGSRALQPRALIVVGLLLFVSALFLTVSPRNPPGFNHDEMAIAYNAATLAAHGRDEYGARFPLFIRSFGDYKSPVYVYALAGIFTVTGPSTTVARTFSAVLGLAAILALFALAFLITRSPLLSLAATLGAGLSPWLFEVSRLTFEVALEPLLIAGLLIALYRASAKQWRVTDAVAIAVLLAAIAYTYQAGKLLAVLYAVGIAGFYGRRQPRAVAAALCLFGLSLVPLLPYDARHPGALTARFAPLTYIHHGMSWWSIASEFVRHYLLNMNLWEWATRGDPNARHHVPGAGSIFFVTTAVALVGLVAVVRCHRTSPWWRFVVFGALVSAVPSSLTSGLNHSLGMIALPVFLAVFTIPGLEWIGSMRSSTLRLAVVAALVLGFSAEAVRWQVVYHRDGPKRADVFEAGFKDAFAGAVRHGGTIYARRSDHGAYIGSLLFGLLDGRPRSSIVILEDGENTPRGAIVMGRPGECVGCTVLGSSGEFQSYIRPG
jgi:hypothetical protein